MKKKMLTLAFVCPLLFGESIKVAAKTVELNKKGAVVDPNKKLDTPTTEVPGEGAVVVKQTAEYFPGGCGFRKALGGLIKVYEICFYGKGMKAAEWASTFDAPAKTKSFKLKLNFLRGVGGKNVSAAFSEGLSKTPAAQKLEEMERQKFLAWAAKLKIEKTSVMEFTFNEDQPMKVAFYDKPDAGTQAQTYESTQKGLAKATAAIWYGDKPLNEDLKKDLLK
jgi:hypothetical protein